MNNEHDAHSYNMNVNKSENKLLKTRRTNRHKVCEDRKNNNHPICTPNDITSINLKKELFCLSVDHQRGLTSSASVMKYVIVDAVVPMTSHHAEVITLI